MKGNARSTLNFSALVSQSLHHIIQALFWNEFDSSLDQEELYNLSTAYPYDNSIDSNRKQEIDCEEIFEVRCSSIEAIGRALLISDEEFLNEDYYWVFANAPCRSGLGFELFKFVSTIRSASEPRDFVTDCYKVLLERLPDNDGLLEYVSRVKSNELLPVQLIRLMLESKEGLSFTEKILVVSCPNIWFKDITPTPRLFAKIAHQS